MEGTSLPGDREPTSEPERWRGAGHLYSRSSKGKSQCSLKAREVETPFQEEVEDGKLDSEGQNRSGQEEGRDR